MPLSMFENGFKTIPNGLDTCTQLNAKPQFMFTAPNRTVPRLFIWVIAVFHSALIQTNNTSNCLQNCEIQWAFTHRSYSTYLRGVTDDLSDQPSWQGQKRKKTQQLPTDISCCHYMNALSLAHILWKLSWKEISRSAMCNPDF